MYVRNTKKHAKCSVKPNRELERCQRLKGGVKRIQPKCGDRSRSKSPSRSLSKSRSKSPRNSRSKSPRRSRSKSRSVAPTGWLASLLSGNKPAELRKSRSKSRSRSRSASKKPVSKPSAGAIKAADYAELQRMQKRAIGTKLMDPKRYRRLQAKESVLRQRLAKTYGYAA